MCMLEPTDIQRKMPNNFMWFLDTAVLKLKQI